MVSRASGGVRGFLVEVGINLALLSVMVAYMFAVVPGYFVETGGGDYPYYVEIARSPLGNSVPSQWRYRILHPLLAAVLIKAGASADVAFFSLTLIFAALSIALLRIFLRQLSLSPFAARAGALLFAVSAGGYIPLRRYHGYSDALVNCVILLVLIFAASRRVVATTIALGVGALLKETTLLLLPFVGWRLHSASVPWRRVAVLLATPIVIYLVLRLVIPPAVGGAALALSLDAQIDYWRTAMVHGWVRWLLWAIAYSMGPVWLLAAVGLRGNGRFVTACSLYLIALLAPLLRTTDTERVLMLSFPVVFPLAAYALDSLRGQSNGVAVVAVAVVCQLGAQLTFDWAPSLRFWVFSPKDVVFLVLCVTPLVALAATRSTATKASRAPLGWPDSRSIR